LDTRLRAALAENARAAAMVPPLPPLNGSHRPPARAERPEAAQTNAESEGDVAVAVAADASAKSPAENAAAAFDDDGPVWPDEAAESAFLSEQKLEVGAAPSAPAKPAATDADDDDGPEAKKTPLPALDELVNRIPAETREVLEDLFRVKFVAVRRMPKQALKR
jgi:hypothetical protein